MNPYQRYTIYILSLFLVGCSTTTKNYFKYNVPKINDIQSELYQKRRVSFLVENPSNPFVEKSESTKNPLSGKMFTLGKDAAAPLEEILKRGNTQSFLMIRNDSILVENYYQSTQKETALNSMSISKSIVATVFGIAWGQGKIHPNDLISKYLPNLKHDLQNHTLEDLLNMQMGLRYDEFYGALLPKGKLIQLYYGEDIYQFTDNRTIPNPRWQEPKFFSYQSINTLLLLRCIEKAVGEDFKSYLEKNLILTLGFEYPAYWETDEAMHIKGFAGFSVTARDLAKIGKLYLQRGFWQGKQILPVDFIKKVYAEQSSTNGGYYNYSFRRNLDFDPLSKKQVRQAKTQNDSTSQILLWNKDYYKTQELPDPDLYAVGLKGNYLYMHPNTNTIIVRTGEDLKQGNVDWASFLRAIAMKQDSIPNLIKGGLLKLKVVE